jgi:DNA-binding CsgD family transcriptional regulator
MEPTLTESGALYLAQHKVEKCRNAFFRRIKAAATKPHHGIVTFGKSSRLPLFNRDNGRWGFPVSAHSRSAALAENARPIMRRPLIAPSQIHSAPIFHFTPREEDILPWLAEGKRSSEIAIILHSRNRTIEKHLGNILKKLCVETRGAAGAFYFRREAARLHELQWALIPRPRRHS